MRLRILNKVQALLVVACLGFVGGISSYDLEARLTDAEKKDFSSHGNKLVLCKLCAKKVRTKHLCAGHIKTEDIDARKLDVDWLCSKTGRINSLCSRHAAVLKLSAKQACVDHLYAATVSSRDVCVQGNVEHCTAFKAFVLTTTITPYTLGTPLQFNTIVDDPNHNIVSLNPTRYIVPRTGYYVATLHIDENNLTGPFVFTGVPVGSPEILVNGTVEIQGRVPYLSFAKVHHAYVTSLLLLHAGDIVEPQYSLFVLDPVLGDISYPGAVDILPQSAGDRGSYFTIHYLSSLCSDETIQECPPCNVTPYCNPADFYPCEPDHDCHHECAPCEPC